MKSKVVSAQNLLSAALVSSKTGRPKVQFLKRDIFVFWAVQNGEWSWATKVSYVCMFVCVCMEQ